MDRTTTQEASSAQASPQTPAGRMPIDLAGQNHTTILPSSARAAEAFGRLSAIVMRLRAPDGCPWDREQTPASLRGSIIEEAYELVEAIDEGDPGHIAEESGDLVLLAVMVAYIMEESGSASIAGALDGLSDKLVRRHPHVFGESQADTSEKVLTQWNEIKEKIEGRRKKDYLLDSVSRALPPLERAYKVQKKVAKVGFDWETTAQTWDKLDEEVQEAREACEALAAGREAGIAESGELHSRLEDELGDMLFSLINVARRYSVDPSLALRRTTERFCRRFHHVETRMRETGVAMETGQLELMDRFWNEAKRQEHQ